MNLLPQILYSGKLSREITFANFTVLWLYAKVFSAKFGVWCPLALQKRAIRESFLCENRIFTNLRKVFSLEGFPLYVIVIPWLRGLYRFYYPSPRARVIKPVQPEEAMV